MGEKEKKITAQISTFKPSSGCHHDNNQPHKSRRGRARQARFAHGPGFKHIIFKLFNSLINYLLMSNRCPVVLWLAGRPPAGVTSDTHASPPSLPSDDTVATELCLGNCQRVSPEPT